jgi:hypothetical protein
MTTRLIGAALLVATALVGFAVRPLVLEDGFRVHGWLVATAYSAGCDDGDKPLALQQWHGRRILTLTVPRAYAAPSACRVLAVRSLRNLIVNAGENFLVDAWQNSVELEIMKYHGIGTGTTAAAEANTALETELTTQYNPDNTRATGSLTEGASTNIFRTVGTNTVDASAAITEWGLLSQAATGGGTLWSRVVFSAINLANGDSLQTTYDLTVE